MAPVLTRRRPIGFYGQLPYAVSRGLQDDEDDNNPIKRLLSQMGSEVIETGNPSTRAAEIQAKLQNARTGGISTTSDIKSKISPEMESLTSAGGSDYTGFYNQLKEISKQGTLATERVKALNKYKQEQLARQQQQQQINIGNYTGPASGRRGALIKSALKYLGTPYSWGGGSTKGPSYGFGRGAGTKGFDCSGLVLYAYSSVGIRMPRVSQQQMTRGVRVPLNKLQPGDLVGKGYPATHIAIYLGNGKIVEAPRTGLNVRTRNISPSEGWWGIHVNI